MKKLLGALFISVGLMASAAHASPDAPQAGTDYTVLAQPQPVSTPAGKIEVTEFFWYGCPHCYAFEPLIESWAKQKGDDVVFRRVPVAFRPDFEPHSRLYLALDSMGIAEQWTPKIFNEIHVKKNYLLTLDAQQKFLAQNGMSAADVTKFTAAYNSFGVVSGVKRAAGMLNDYKVDGVPTVIIQGKYVTSPAQTNSLDGTIKVMNWIDQQIRDKKL